MNSDSLVFAPIFGTPDADSTKLSPFVLPPFELIEAKGLEARMAAMEPAGLDFIDFLWENKVKLSIGIFACFFVSYTTIAAIGLLPPSLVPEGDAPAMILATSTNAAPIALASSTPAASAPKQLPSREISATNGENPVHIVIPSIDVDAKVTSPETNSDDVLDQYLLQGPVRYPGSAGLGAGNTFIFGHSTNHAVVVNQAFKSFDHLGQLQSGNIIEVDSIDREYVYKVTTVRLATADQIFVDFSGTTNMLTLSTCDTFASKEDRYVVEATFVNSSLITENSI